MGDDFGALKIATDDFLEFIKQLDELFESNIDNLINQTSICCKIKSTFLNAVTVSWFTTDNDSPCYQTLIKVVEYFIRVRLYFICTNINQELTTLKKTKENRKYKKICHL